MTPRSRTRLRRVAPWLLAALVLTLLGRQARTLDWPAVIDAVRDQSPLRFVVATALGALSHALYGSFDLIGRRLVHHDLSTARTMATAAISYVFNLNFGALVGGMAMRLRMYTRQGLEAGTVGELIATSLVTNWLGYLLVGGAVLLAAPPPLPQAWPVSTNGARLIGAAMGTAGLGYLLACRFSRRRDLRWRSLRLRLPGTRLALLQALLSSLNWLLIGTLMWVLFADRVPWSTVVAVLLLASIAGVLTHVPAGLGVIEAVFVAVLGGQVPPPQLLASLLAYRVAYNLLPLAWAVPAWAVGESRVANAARGRASPTAHLQVRDSFRNGTRS